MRHHIFLAGGWELWLGLNIQRLDWGFPSAMQIFLTILQLETQMHKRKWPPAEGERGRNNSPFCSWRAFAGSNPVPWHLFYILQNKKSSIRHLSLFQSCSQIISVQKLCEDGYILLCCEEQKIEKETPSLCVCVFRLLIEPEHPKNSV